MSEKVKENFMGATQADYTCGTNAAMPVAQKFIAQLVPSEFQGMIPLLAMHRKFLASKEYLR